jgi:hypothetical protein
VKEAREAGEKSWTVANAVVSERERERERDRNREVLYILRCIFFYICEALDCGRKIREGGPQFLYIIGGNVTM